MGSQCCRSALLMVLVCVSRCEAYMDIRIMDDPAHHIRYVSGDVIYVESMKEDRWCGNFWSPDGRINLPYEGWAEAAFQIGLQTSPADSTPVLLAGGWRWLAATELQPNERGARHVAVDLENPERALKVRIHTLLDGTPVLVRWLEIHNTGNQPVGLRSVYPWAGRLWPGKKFSLGYYTRQEWSEEGWFEWKGLEPGTTQTVQGKAFDDPFFIVRNDHLGEFFIAHLAWSDSWKMEFTAGPKALTFGIGPDSSDVQRVLAPQETVVTPAIHMGHVSGSMDRAVQSMHDHLRRFVFRDRDPERAYRVQYLVPADQGYYKPFDEASALKCVDVAESIGAELFILDAYWWDVTCDWTPSPTRFPHGLKPVVDAVHSKGMQFGLYVESEGGRGNVEESRIAKEHPDWIGPKKVLNLTIPAAAEWMESEICRLIEENNLDLYRLDFNPCQFDPLITDVSGFRETWNWRYYNTLYSIYERLRVKYPQVTFQQCAAGGMRNDLGLVSRFDEPYLTDGLNIPREFQVYSGLTLGLPPENFVVLHGADGQTGIGKPHNLDTILRLSYSLATPQIFVGTVAPSVEELSSERKEHFLRYARIYKDFMRPVLPKCLMFHHAPVSNQYGVSESPWFAVEFASPDGGKGWAMVARLGKAEQNEYWLHPKGLNPSKQYRVTIDSQDATTTVDGFHLMQDGLRVNLEEVCSSELFLFEAVQ